MDKENTNNQSHGAHPKTGHHSTHHKTEAFGITDRELKSKDEVQKQLTITFDWLVAHKFLVFFVLGIFLLSGLGYVVYSKTKLETELKIQEQYFTIEKKYLDQRTQFDEAEREHKAEQEKKNDKNAKKDSKVDEKNKTTTKALATGDLEKDYGFVVKDFNDLVSAQPRSLAGKMASLMLADIYADYSKHEEALVVLEKAVIPNPKKLIDLLVAKKQVNAMLTLNKFAEAEKELLKLVNQKAYPFMTSQFKLSLGLAYEGLKMWDKAESQFQEIIAKGTEAENLPPEEMAKRNRFSSEVSTLEQAQKYLILLKQKKDSEKVGS